MRDVKLKGVQCVQDLRVKFSSRCMFSHCNDEANKVNRMLSFIKRNFSLKNKDAILPPYNTLVRPHLEYAAQFWSPAL